MANKDVSPNALHYVHSTVSLERGREFGNASCVAPDVLYIVRSKQEGCVLAVRRVAV
jgi:hypothetical protein